MTSSGGANATVNTLAGRCNRPRPERRPGMLRVIFRPNGLKPALRRLVAVFILLVAALAGPAAAQQPAAARPAIAGVRVGFDGRYKVGYWTPVEVTIKGGVEPLTGEVELILPDGDGLLTRVRSERPVDATPGQFTRTLLYAKFGQIDGRLTVRFMVDGKTRAERSWDSGVERDDRHILYPLSATDELIVTLGRSIGVAPAVTKPSDSDGSQVAVAALDGVAQLPTRWYGYEGVDALVLATSDPVLYRPLSGNQRANALLLWVEMGGRVL